MSVWTDLVNRLKAFSEKMLVSTPAKEADYNDYDARRVRYDILWSFYESTAYRTIHSWSVAYKNQLALYKWLRAIRNPAHTIGEFMVGHIWGGQLDPTAGNGGAIPIETDNEALRSAISEIWKWSQWWRNKDTLTRFGAVLGDVGLRVIDDVERKHVYLEIVHPSHIKAVTLDPFGNCKGYEYVEDRIDDKGRVAVYSEVVSRDGDLVVYRTFRDGKPYAWNDETAEWTNAYGFVPFVLIKHIDVGLDWGWSEFHAAASRIREVDELTSMLSDHLRKTIDPLWLMKKVSLPGTRLSTTTATTDIPEPGREEIRAIWNLPADADAKALTTTLDIAAVTGHIDKIMLSLETDYPEIKVDLATPGNSISGRALRIARQPLESRVLQRRVAYDAALIAVNNMAMAIGGYRGYDGYKGFGLDSYGAGKLEHSIGFRPVFEEDPEDTALADKTF